MRIVKREHPRQEARAFWAGPPLSPYEELSLLSFIAAGARVLLYSNDMSLRVPAGVSLVDINELFSQNTHAFTYEDGDRCLTPHSDLFRYAAVAQYGGWYFDLDIVCLHGRLPEDKVYLARETDHIVNAAVMKFPAHSPFLVAAREEAYRLWPRAGRLTIGPDLVTRLAGEYALDHLIRPRVSAYAIGTTEILAMFDPRERERLEERVLNSDFVHLWNEIWRRLRIPKNFGPPEGSFLDGLFQRFDMRFFPEARLSLDALHNWQRERHLLAQVAARLDTDTVPDNAFGLLIQQAERRGVAPFSSYRPEPSTTKSRPAAPQTVRTFWHGGPIGPWQLLCLRSFADQGHHVEVFTFDAEFEVPQWLSLRDAAEIVPADRVVRYLPEAERFAIHANLFRYAMLHQLGGWWVDPDVILLKADMPAEQVFVAGPNQFNLPSSAVLKVPAGHSLMADALGRMAPFEGSVSTWDDTGAQLLSSSIRHTGFTTFAKADLADPVPWFDVTSLFDPAQADDIERRCADRLFLVLHYDVWLRAGVPDFLGPPAGSFLDRLLQRHRIGFQFAERMNFEDVRRWMTHMYDSVRLRGSRGDIDTPVS